MHYDIFGKILPRKKDSQKKKSIKITTLIALGAIIFMILISIITFFLAIKGDDEVLVPNVVLGEGGDNCDILSAMDKLKTKRLYAIVNVKYSNEYKKYTVISQYPEAGAVVKPGRHIELTVSNGAIVNSIGNYIGMTLDELKLQLKEIFAAGFTESIVINDLSYIYSKKPEGIIIEQSPEPDSKIIEGDIVYLDLILSKGPEPVRYHVGNYTGRNYLEVIEELNSFSLPFTFKTRPAQPGEKNGVVVSQEQEPGSYIPELTVIELMMTEPANIGEGKIFSVYLAEIPKFPVLMNLKLMENFNGTLKQVVSLKHPGGVIGIPYIIDENAQVELYIDGELYR